MNLTTRVFVGMLAGIAFGLLLPEAAIAIDVVGVLFIRAIQMVVVPLILFSVTLGVAEIRDMKALGRAGVVTLLFTAVTNFLSSLSGVAAGVLVEPASGVTVPDAARMVTPTMPSWRDILSSVVPANVPEALVEGNVLAIIFFSAFLGTALVAIGDKGKPVLDFLRSGSDVIATMIRMILRFAPYGVFALMASTMAEVGAAALTAMAKLLVTIWIGTIVFVTIYASVVSAAIVKRNPIEFFRALGDVSMMGIATCSSMATMPLNVERTHEKFSVPRETAAMVIGAGTSILNGGSSFYKAIGVVFVASLYGVELDTAQLLVIAAIAAFLITAGVPAAGTLAIAVGASAIGVPVEGIALLMAIDRLRDMVSTWGNVVIHSLGALVVHQVATAD